MVKENTHLFAADKIIKKIKGKEIKSVINSGIDYYYLGSIAPDIFFYNDKIKDISDKLHGKEGNPTNKIIFDMLDKVRITKSKKDLAFVFGYITHCALDSTFHPVVYFLSGNYYDKDASKRESAVYSHRLIETYIDKGWNKSFFVVDLIKPKLADELIFSEVIAKNEGISRSKVKRCLKKQLFFNRLFKSRVMFHLFFFMGKIGIVNRTELSLFYAILEKDKLVLKPKIDYLDIVSGKRKETTINKLLDDSISLAQDMIKAAYNYYTMGISKKQCAEIIDGRSLDTGKLNVATSEIRYAGRAQTNY